MDLIIEKGSLMQLYSILFLTLTGFGHACLGSSAAVQSTSLPTLLDQSRRVEKKDLLGRVINTLPADKDATFRNAIFHVAISALGDSYEAKPRAIVSADGKNTYGQSFPLDPEVLMDIIDLAQGKTVLEIAAAHGENAVLLGLAGAERVVINDIEPAELEKCRERLEELPADTRAKFTLAPGDCLKVFAGDEYTACFDVIYARNIMHFLFGEKREQFIHTVHRLLKPDGHLIITANSAQPLLATKKIVPISHEYVFKQRGYKLRLPEGHINFFQTFKVEDDLTTVDPVRSRYIPLIRFTEHGIYYEKEFVALPSEDKARLNNHVADCIEEYGLHKLALDGRAIECHENQTICYMPVTLEEAFSGVGLVAQHSQFTDLSGHIAVHQNKANHLTMFFKKQPVQ